MRNQGFTGGVKIEGLELCLKNLHQLGTTKAKAVNRRALVSASTIPLKTAKTLVPKDTGQLKKSLGKKQKTYRSTGTTWVGIGARPGFKDPQTGRNPVRYAHLVELGTVRAKAKPFLRPALMQSKDSVIRTYKTRLWEGIRREVEKMRK